MTAYSNAQGSALIEGGPARPPFSVSRPGITATNVVTLETPIGTVGLPSVQYVMTDSGYQRVQDLSVGDKLRIDLLPAAFNGLTTVDRSLYLEVQSVLIQASGLLHQLFELDVATLDISLPGNNWLSLAVNSCFYLTSIAEDTGAAIPVVVTYSTSP